jgi:RNA polymerase sigma factor (sigma-70 family)
MPDTTDSELIRQFARDHSEAAFAELVRRHINLVYSVARRCTNHATDAEDVTQIVFHIFARKAPGLKTGTVLGGWFYTTTRFAAARFLRGKMRREAREQESTAMQETLGELEHDSDATWRQLVPHLETAMSLLSDGDRTLLVLRFFENKTGAQTASMLGIHEAAAHKRTARALEKLREFFVRRGITLSTAALATALSTHSVQAAPNHWIAPIAAAATGAKMTSIISGIVHETLRAMAWAKAKWTLGLVSAAVATGVVGIAIASIGGSSPPTK